MSRGDFLNKRQTETEAALVPRLLVSAAIELFEDLRLLFGRNSVSLVRNLKPYPACAVRNPNSNGGARRTVLDRIRHEIRERLVHQKPTGLNLLNIVSPGGFQSDLFFRCDRANNAQHVLKDRRN